MGLIVAEVGYHIRTNQVGQFEIIGYYIAMTTILVFFASCPPQLWVVKSAIYLAFQGIGKNRFGNPVGNQKLLPMKRYLQIVVPLFR